MKSEDREPALEFWFDFASTYSYVGAMRIEDLCRKAGVRLAWMPFLLGPIFALQGWNDSPFNINERRGAYMWRDMERLAEKFGLPWVRPSAFPRSSTLAARVACSASGDPWCADFVRATYVANFGRDENIGERAIIEEILRTLGLPPDSIIDRALGTDERSHLRVNTERAVQLGIFGAPNCLVRDELFWGEEALEDAIAWAARGVPPD